MQNMVSNNSSNKFYAIFDNGLPAGNRYGMEANGGNRWVGAKIQITPEAYELWHAGKDVKFMDYGLPFTVESHLFRVVQQQTITTVYETNLSR